MKTYLIALVAVCAAAFGGCKDARGCGYGGGVGGAFSFTAPVQSYSYGVQQFAAPVLAETACVVQQPLVQSYAVQQPLVLGFAQQRGFYGGRLNLGVGRGWGRLNLGGGHHHHHHHGGNGGNGGNGGQLRLNLGGY